ncbi:IS30 family transposase, partial [Streptomyces sp. NPDC005727]
AQARADARRPRPKPGKISRNPELREFIQHRLHLRWSPEQVCQALRAQFPQRPEMRFSAHTREHLAAVAAELNGRPRKTLGWETPAERPHKLLAA